MKEMIINEGMKYFYQTAEGASPPREKEEKSNVYGRSED